MGQNKMRAEHKIKPMPQVAIRHSVWRMCSKCHIFYLMDFVNGRTLLYVFKWIYECLQITSHWHCSLRSLFLFECCCITFAEWLVHRKMYTMEKLKMSLKISICYNFRNTLLLLYFFYFCYKIKDWLCLTFNWIIVTTWRKSKFNNIKNPQFLQALIHLFCIWTSFQLRWCYCNFNQFLLRLSGP